MCLMNYCSYCMYFELFYFRNLAPEELHMCMHNYKNRLTKDDTATYLCSLKIQSVNVT